MNPAEEFGTYQPFYHRFNPKLNDGERAWVFGVITAVRGSKNTIFFDMLHTLGSLQIVAERNRLDPVWDKIKVIKTRDRMKVKGVMGRTRQGTRSLFLEDLPLSASTFLDETLSSTDPDYRQIGASILIAQARSAAEGYLSEKQYRRVDPRYLSASWPIDDGVIPLNVNYPGFGVPVYLAPSPAQQLSLAIAATGDDRVYCSATNFTTSYRQPSDGSETAIVMAMMLGLELNGSISLATGLIDAVCGLLPGIDRRYPAGSLQERFCSLSDLVGVETGGENAIWIHPEVDGVQPYRIVLEEGASPIEGCVERHKGGIAIGMLVFHAERMLPLAQHVQFRRLLRHLGPDPASSKGNPPDS